MNKITNIIELQQAIVLLETRQAYESALLKEEFNITYEKLKPLNLVKDSIKNFITSPNLKSNLVDSGIGLAAGWLTKKAAIGGTHNPIKKLFGALLQLGVTGVVAENAEGIKSVGALFLNKIFKKKVKSD